MNNPTAAGGAPMFKRVNELKRLLQEDTENVRILRELANLHYDAAMWGQAVSYYERLAKLQPTPDVLTDLGASYRGVGQYDRALESFARAREMDSSHWQSLYNTIVVAVSDLGRADLAEQALEAMEAIEPRPQELTDAQLQQLRQAIEALASRGEQPS
jgi:tetratricopeptide (TPR) repeat protein